MDINSSASDPRTAFQLIQWIGYIQTQEGFNRAANAFTVEYGAPAICQRWDITDLVPIMAVFVHESVAVCLVSGLTTSDQVGTLVLSWLEGRQRRGINGFIRVGDVVSDAIYGRLEAAGALNNNRIILAGYSFGGACLPSLATRLGNASPQRVVSLATFGSPSPGDDRLVQAMMRVDYHRYMNDGDNVVWAPPVQPVAPLMHLLLTRFESINIENCIQVGQGSVLSAGGGISRAGYPPNDSIFTDLSIVNFLYSNEAPVAIAHRIPEYVNRLGMWIDANPRPPVRERAGAVNNINVPEPVQEQPVPPMPVDMPAMMQQLPNNGDLPVNQLPVRPVPRMPMADEEQGRISGPMVPQGTLSQPPKPYHARKVGRVWVVYFVTSDRVVIIAKGKSQAKRMAARMNSALAIYDNAAWVDEGAMEQSVIDAFN